MKGTSGMRTRMAHASFAPPEISVRDSKSIQMRTTAKGWRKQRSSSTTFFMVPNLGHALSGFVLPRRPAPPGALRGGTGIAWSLRCHWNADAYRHAEPEGPQPGLARPADAALPRPAADWAGPR